MDLGKLGTWSMLEEKSLRETVDFAHTLERLGYSALWIPEGSGPIHTSTAQIGFGLKRPDVADRLRAYLETVASRKV